MSKELEALKPSVILKFVNDLLKRYEDKTDYNIYITKEWLLEIKLALQRLEAIDNSKPSEALEEIGNIDLGDNPYKTFERNKLKNVYNKEFGTINQALQRLESIDNANPSEFKIVNYKGQYYLQINVNDDEATQIQLPLLEDEIQDVQLAIDKFKQINQAKPSEALKCLDRLARFVNPSCEDGYRFDQYEEDYNCIQQALIKAQEKENKALAFDYLVKHFNFEFKAESIRNGELWARFITIQSKADEDTWDTTAMANLRDYKEEYEFLEKMLKPKN